MHEGRVRCRGWIKAEAALELLKVRLGGHSINDVEQEFRVLNVDMAVSIQVLPPSPSVNNSPIGPVLSGRRVT